MRTSIVVWQRQQNLSHSQLVSGISHWAHLNLAWLVPADMSIM